MYGYDEENRLVYANTDVGNMQYTITEEGLRSGKSGSVGGADYVTDIDGKVIQENEAEIIVGHQALAKKIGDAYYYYIYNAHGDVIMMVDESGNIKNTYEYDAWGKITEETETVPNSIKYAGEYYDAETGFIYLRNRMYDPATRRFTSEDPARDQLNWYAYCGNNPVMFVDPSGCIVQGDMYFDTHTVTKLVMLTLAYYSSNYIGANPNHLAAKATQVRLAGTRTSQPNVSLSYAFDFANDMNTWGFLDDYGSDQFAMYVVAKALYYFDVLHRPQGVDLNSELRDFILEHGLGLEIGPVLTWQDVSMSSAYFDFAKFDAVLETAASMFGTKTIVTVTENNVEKMLVTVTDDAGNILYQEVALQMSLDWLS